MAFSVIGESFAVKIELLPDASLEDQRINEPTDLDACPRCGEPIEDLVWGQTNCPRCGLHFECC